PGKAASAGGARRPGAASAAARRRLARAHAVGAPAAFHPLPERRRAAPGEAARGSGARRAARGGDRRARKALPDSSYEPAATRPGRRRPGAIRLAARRAAGVALRPGAEDAGAGLVQAPRQALANSGEMTVAH